MATRALKPARPEDVVEAALREVPAKAPVLEIATASIAKLVRALRGFDVVIDAAELEAQLVEAGLHLHGSRGGRRNFSAAPFEKVAAELKAALGKGAAVFSVLSEHGPRLVGPIDRSALRAAGLASEGAVLNVGRACAVPGLVTAALLGWARGPGRRLRAREAWIVTGGRADPGTAPTWQACLQRLADDAELVLHVRHLPAGVSRWTKPRAPVARVHTVEAGGEVTSTVVERVYARRPARTPAPVTVRVEQAAPVSGRRSVRAEGRPAARRYRISPRG